MKLESRIVYGVLIMVFFFIAGVVGTVSAADASQRDPLQLEVRLLEQINQLHLTPQQIDQLLPVLKNVQEILQQAETDHVGILAEEKELLLQNKTKEAQALQVEERVIREKAALQIKTVLLDLQTILTPEQIKALQSNRLGSGWRQTLQTSPSTGKKDVAYLHGTSTGDVRVESINGMMLVSQKANEQGAVRVESPNGMVLVSQKANEQGAVRVESPNGTVLVSQKANEQGTVRVESLNGMVLVSQKANEQGTVRVEQVILSSETMKVILEQQEAQLKELETQITKAVDPEKSILQKRASQLKNSIVTLRQQFDPSNDGRIIIKRSGSLNQPLSGNKAPRGSLRTKIRAAGRWPGRLQDGEFLSTLIRVLEEYRNAN